MERFDTIDVLIEERKYPSDATKQTFSLQCGSNQELINLVKWCRKTLGHRGDGWDFVSNSSNNRLNITIENSTLLMLWYLYK